MFSIGTPVKHKRGSVGWIEATARCQVRIHWVKGGPDGRETSVYTLEYARLVLERV
jgi:hypothetical protein